MRTVEFAGARIRTLLVGGRPVLHAADVCRSLSFRLDAKDQPNVTVAILPVDREEIVRPFAPEHRAAFLTPEGVGQMVQRVLADRAEEALLLSARDRA